MIKILHGLSCDINNEIQGCGGTTDWMVHGARTQTPARFISSAVGFVIPGRDVSSVL